MNELTDNTIARRYGFVVLAALICLFTFSSTAIAGLTCSGVTEYLGTEYVAECDEDGPPYRYVQTDIRCIGGQVVKGSSQQWMNGGSFMSPEYAESSIVSAATFSSSTLFGNSAQTHYVVVTNTFAKYNGYLDGIALKSLAKAPTVHRDQLSGIGVIPKDIVDLDVDGDGVFVCNDCDDNDPLYHDNCPPAHCSNGVQDEDETGVDCGGSCPDTCPVPLAPKLKEPAKKSCVDFGSTAGADTGEYFHSQDLLSLQGPPLSANVRLSYRSFGRSGTLGTGWRHSYDIAIRDDGSGNRVVRIGGKERLFTFDGSVWVSEVDDYSSLVDNGDGTFSLTEKSGLKYDFNSFGSCSTITDRNGNQIVLAYNVDDLLDTVTDSAGRVLTFAYNPDGTLASITDPKSNSYSFIYTSGQLTAVQHPDGNSWAYSYDGDGYLLSKTDPAGFVTSYVYDAENRIIQSTDPNTRTRLLAYPTDTTPTTLSTTFTDKNGSDWIYTYDTAAGVLLSKTDPEGFTTSYSWDADKNLLSKTEPGAVATSYTYDANGNILTTTDALGRVTTFTYNSFGQILTAVGPRGTLENSYDANGNLTQVTNFDNSVTLYNTSSRGQVTKITDALSRETDFVYDANGLLQSITPPSGIIQSFTYDANGNLLTQTVGGQTSSFTYDSINRVSTVTDPLGNVTTTTYDGNGNPDIITDAETRATDYDTNEQGQVTRIEDALSGVTALAYGGGCTGCGGVDQLTSLTDPAGQTTSFEYSAAGNLSKETDPLGKITSYLYEDGRGNLTSRTDANGQTILYQYDKLNRLTQKTLPGSVVINYGYDPTTGDLISVTGPDISYNFAYDTLGRMTGVTDSRGYSLSYSYNDLGQRTQVTLPGSQTIVYGYDTGNRLSSLTTEAGTFGFGYDSKDRRSSLSYPNGINTIYSYDNADRLTSLIHSATAGEILNIAYPQLDKLGNRLQRSEDGTTTDYSYDVLYRLLNATDSEGAENFTYDDVGNRESGPTVKDTPEASYDYNNAHQMTQGRKFAYTYDNNGNQLTRSQKNGKTWTQAWDAENRLIQVSRTNGADSSIVTFKYDPFGRRIEKQIVNSFNGDTITKTTHYVYDAEDIVLQIEEVTHDSTTTTTETRFIHGPGIDEPLAFARDGQSYFYHADGLGSIVAITDSAQAIAQKYSYESFGLPTPQTTLQQPYLFTSREWDPEIGLYFYRARYYDPMEGRFVSADPLKFNGGDLNLFAYVRNQPINFLDPSGLMTDAGTWGAIGTGLLAVPVPGARVVGGAILVTVVLSISGDTPLESDECSDDDDFCYQRWLVEDNRCKQWSNLGRRVVTACKVRAADRRTLCYRNDGMPNPEEPPEYNPFADYPR